MDLVPDSPVLDRNRVEWVSSYSTLGWEPPTHFLYLFKPLRCPSESTGDIFLAGPERQEIGLIVDGKSKLDGNPPFGLASLVSVVPSENGHRKF